MTKRRGLWVACCAALVGCCSTASAVVCVVPDAGGTAQMPPNCPGGYQSPSDVHMIIDGLPPGTTIIADASHDKFGITSSGPGGSLGGEFEQFNSLAFMELQGTGGLSGFHRFVNVPLFCETHIGPRPFGAPTQSFDTDMFSMQGQIVGDPDFDLLRITAGTGFGMPSPGHTTLSQVPGGWAVDSFFDITYRIDFVGRPGGALSGMSGSTTGTIRMAMGGQQACCLPPAGSGCADLRPEECCAAGGLPQGPGTDCSTALCGTGANSPRACCLPSGACAFIPVAQCCAQGGTPGNVGQPCTAGLCVPQQTGACCYPSGACSDVTAAQCAATGGNFNGPGTTCALIHCLPLGACCLGTDCTITSQPGCNGTWHGAGSNCNDNDGDGRADICAPSTTCDVTPSGTCTDTICPVDGDRCVSRCIRWNPATGQARATDCDCRSPNECHAQSAATGPSPLRGGGNPCVVADNGSGTVTLPPQGCEYLSPDDVHMIIDGLPAGTTIELTGIHRDFVCNRQPGAAGVCSHPVDVDCDEPGGSLGGNQECADSQINFQLQGTGGLSGFNRSANIPLSFETHVAPRTPGDPVQSFDTDMFRMFGQITGDPDFDLLRIVGGTDFGLPSPGHTTLTQLPGGDWAVDSFFDITYRIDFVGAPGGALAGMSGSTTGTIRMATGGGTPSCVGACPVGTVCNETRTILANGEVDVCCDCVPVQEECAPLPDGSDCAGLCEGDDASCVAKCVEVNPFTGDVRIVECACAPGDVCHLVGTVTTPGIEVRGGAGNPCVVTDNGSGTVTLPPAGCQYLSPDEVHMIVDGLPAGTTLELAPIHKDFICSGPAGHQGVCSFAAPPGFCEQPGGTLSGYEDCAESTADFDIKGTGALAAFNRSASIPLSFEVHSGPRTPGDPVQSFDTDMFRMFGQITGDPDFDLLRIVGGTDFGLPSPGHTTLTQLPGGQWAVDSFFDITYRIDFVGAAGGPLAGMSGSTTATIRMAAGGIPGVCEGACPPGTTCNESRTVSPTGTIKVCCDCVPIVEDCGPTPNGDGCTPTTCPVPGEECAPKCMNYNPATGQTTVIACDCSNVNECHVVAGLDATRGGNPPCVVPDNGGGTVTLPPAGCGYLSPSDVHMILDGLPPGTTIELGAEHSRFFCGGSSDGTPGGVCTVVIPPGQCEVPGGPLSGQLDCFSSDIALDLNGTGALAGFSRSLSLPLSCQAATGPRTPGNPVQMFPNDMRRMQGQLPPGDPDFDLLRITGGTEFGLPSPGQTTLTQLPGGQWHVDSFFDITYRIDFIGAPGGPLAGMSGSTTATIRMAAAGPGVAQPPHCEGVCPTGTLCNETRTLRTDGTFDVCCDCVPIQTGACCLSTAGDCSCADVTAAECAAIGGLFRGAGSSCAVDGEACATGACCHANGTCTDTNASDCRGFVCDVADYCPAGWAGCYADADCNGVVNAGDRGVISANIGQSAPELVCRYDLDGNGVINPGDRGIVSANIGSCSVLPNWQNGSGCNQGNCPDPRFPQPTFTGCGTNCASTTCP